MKRMFIMMSMLMVCTLMFGQKPAEIKFDKITHNFGKFSEKNAKQECVFTFTNVGQQPLLINQAIASCGCTVPKYTKTPIAPGQKGELKVVYNGTGRPPGYFTKIITVQTNGRPETTRLYIKGEMGD